MSTEDHKALLDKIATTRSPGMGADWSLAATNARDEELARLVAEAQALGIYPMNTPEGNRNTVLQMVQGWGAYWNVWAEPLNCPHCKTDLRDHVMDAPGKREIAIYDQNRDRTTHFVCPDCQGVIPR